MRDASINKNIFDRILLKTSKEPKKITIAEFVQNMSIGWRIRFSAPAKAPGFTQFVILELKISVVSKAPHAYSPTNST